MGHIFAVSGYRNGPFGAGRNGAGVARVSKCLYLQCLRVSCFWQFSEAFPHSREVVFWTTANPFLLGRSGPKNARKGVCVCFFARFSFCCFHAWRRSSQLGDGHSKLVYLLFAIIIISVFSVHCFGGLDWLFCVSSLTFERFTNKWGRHCFVFSDVMFWMVLVEIGPEGPHLT